MIGDVFWLFCKTFLLSKNFNRHFLGKFWQKLDYFLFQHLVTLFLSFIDCPVRSICSPPDLLLLALGIEPGWAAAAAQTL